MELDGDSGGERTWRVGYWSFRTEDTGARYYDHTLVKACTAEIVDGALVFRSQDGQLKVAYGPTGWDTFEPVAG